MTNLLFLFTDEQKASTLAAYGNSKIQMPNLNRLAAEGCVFEKSYVTQPVCTPSRSSLLTGLYPHTNTCTANNIPLPEQIDCMPEMLPRDKYVTGYHGKWHLGDEIFRQHGFDEWRAIEDGYLKYYRPKRDRDARSSYYHFLVENGYQPGGGNTFSRGTCARFQERYGKPAYLAGEASRFIRENKDDDFVLFVNFLEPHMPFHSPRNDQYDPEDITLPEDFNDVPTTDQHPKPRLLYRTYRERGFDSYSLSSEISWRQIISNYWGLCSLVDTYSGKILDTLRECGLYDDTVIVFTSDHGDMMGSHRLLAKGIMYEEAATVPMIVRMPGQEEPMTFSEPVSQIDLLPTLLDLLGERIPHGLQGKSLKPVLEGESGIVDDVFVEWNGPNTGVGKVFVEEGSTEDAARAAMQDPIRTVITRDGWKFDCSPLGYHELYNLKDDPHETRNLALDPENRPLMRELLGSIRKWQERTEDTVELPEDLTPAQLG